MRGRLLTTPCACWKNVSQTDLEPKASVCYGLLARWQEATEPQEQIWLRFAKGHAMSGLTTQFLAWCCDRVQACGKRVLALIRDNASWHLSAEVKQWVRAHNQQVKRQGHGGRLLICPLPTQSLWLNLIEPKWQFGKRLVVELTRILSVDELAE